MDVVVNGILMGMYDGDFFLVDVMVVGVGIVVVEVIM